MLEGHMMRRHYELVKSLKKKKYNGFGVITGKIFFFAVIKKTKKK